MTADFVDFKIDWSDPYPDIDFFSEITGEETIVNEVVSSVLADVGSYYWQPSAGTYCTQSKGKAIFPADILFLKSQVISNINSNEFVDESTVDISIDVDGRLRVAIAIVVNSKQFTRELVF